MPYLSNHVTCKIVINELTELHKTYPAIATKIETMWGIDSGHYYMLSILNKNRKRRAGFPLDAYTHIMRLFLIHLSEYGDFGQPAHLCDVNMSLA